MKLLFCLHIIFEINIFNESIWNFAVHFITWSWKSVCLSLFNKPYINEVCWPLVKSWNVTGLSNLVPFWHNWGTIWQLCIQQCTRDDLNGSILLTWLCLLNRRIRSYVFLFTLLNFIQPVGSGPSAWYGSFI